MEKIKFRERDVTCPRSYSKEVEETRFKPRSADTIPSTRTTTLKYYSQAKEVRKSPRAPKVASKIKYN